MVCSSFLDFSNIRLVTTSSPTSSPVDECGGGGGGGGGGVYSFSVVALSCSQATTRNQSFVVVVAFPSRDLGVTARYLVVACLPACLVALLGPPQKV
ncbi:hypothetical protein P167DRAFT_531437 [Morchella conica CCBAS932]|uniref:Uncharacterized protein n=1 Tax=Morchella conica CCBAS932 TaxID=1392247 RepID=A0A3N4L2T5_9PEZI|nr:hypothetical protein P167DRAFT_531437 [Morchella conica CCBAS932]